eukprot:c23934_g1_i1 orf=1030-3666(+)
MVSMPYNMMSIEETLASLDHESKQPSLDNLLSAVQKCRQNKNLAHAKCILKYIRDHGLETHPILASRLVPMFVDCGSVTIAQQVFDKLAERSEFSWTSLIQGYIYQGDLHHAFDMYHKMRDDGVHPSKFTFVSLLKASAHRKSIDRGREMHMEVVNEEFESNVFVGNSLIDMYAKCGCLIDAQEVFDTLSGRDVVSWNTLIAAYAEHGLRDEALNCFDKMKVDGVVQDAVTFLCSLKACGTRETIDKGLEIHAEIVFEGFDDALYVKNSLINVYAKSRLVAEAQDVFDDLQVKDIVSWNTLITAYAENGLCEEVLNCFKQMQKEDVSLDAVTFLCSLRACGSMCSIERGREIHAEVVKEGFDEDLFVGNTLMDMYVKCGCIPDAKDIFDQLPVRDVVSWNVLLTGCADLGLVDEALTCFKQMQGEGVSANSSIYLCILKCFSSRGTLDKGQDIHLDIVKKGFEIDPFIGNSVMDMYAKCGSLGEAIVVFDQLQSRDVVTWNTIMAGYVEHGLGEEALDCFERMQPMGVLPDSLSFICALKSCNILGDLDIGQEMHAEIIKQELENEMFIGNTLVDLYAKRGWHVEARDVFDHLPERNVISWTALISGYAEHGLGSEVLDCLDQMQSEGIYPDAVVLIGSLKGCGTVGALERGREIHTAVTKAGFELVCSNTVGVYSESSTSSLKATEMNLSNALIDMYTKCGSMIDAQKVFESLPVADVVAWNALIAGYARQEEGELVTRLVQSMREKGIEPDELSTLNVLSVCSHVGLLDEGQKYFEGLFKEDSATLTIGHFNCLLDLFGRAGRLDEAAAVLEQVPLQLDLVTWSTILDGCRKRGNVELSRKAFPHAVHSAEERTSAFILMSDIYAGCLVMEGAEGD